MSYHVVRAWLARAARLYASGTLRGAVRLAPQRKGPKVSFQGPFHPPPDKANSNSQFTFILSSIEEGVKNDLRTLLLRYRLHRLREFLYEAHCLVLAELAGGTPN
jgi:hypothetical protein